MKKCELQSLKLNILIIDFFIKHAKKEHHVKIEEGDLHIIKEFYKKERLNNRKLNKS